MFKRYPRLTCYRNPWPSDPPQWLALPEQIRMNSSPVWKTPPIILVVIEEMVLGVQTYKICSSFDYHPSEPFVRTSALLSVRNHSHTDITLHKQHYLFTSQGSYYYKNNNVPYCAVPFKLLNIPDQYLSLCVWNKSQPSFYYSMQTNVSSKDSIRLQN